MTKTTITIESLESMTLAGLTDVYNQHAPKAIKKFTCSKSEAIERVVKVLPAAQPKAKSSGNSKAGPRTGVCAWLTEQLSNGLQPKDIFAVLHGHFPNAKTSLKAIYWMRSYLRSQGAQV